MVGCFLLAQVECKDNNFRVIFSVCFCGIAPLIFYHNQTYVGITPLPSKDCQDDFTIFMALETLQIALQTFCKNSRKSNTPENPLNANIY